MFLYNPKLSSAGVQSQTDVAADAESHGFATGPQSGIRENLVANLATKFSDTHLAMRTQIRRRMRERADTIEKLTGTRIEHDYLFPELSAALEDDAIKPSENAYGHYGRAVMNAKTGTSTQGADEVFSASLAAEKQIEALRKQYPQIPSYADILKGAVENAQLIREQRDETAARSTTAGAAAGFVGSMMGVMNEQNPWTLATLPVGGFGKTIAARVGTEFLTQSALEYVNQFHFIKKEREIYGDEFNAGDAAANVIAAGVGGAVIRGGMESVPMLKNTVRAKAEQTYKAMDALATKNTRLGRLAAKIKNSETPMDAAQILREAPTNLASDLIEKIDPQPTESVRVAQASAEPEILLERILPRGMEWSEHVARAEQTQTALEAGDALPEFQPMQANTLGRSLPAVSVRDLKVDAKTFQFKGGGDDFGVTERLKGITEWNPELAGNIVVWEAKDGTRYIADGHQRTGLASRIMRDNPQLDIRIPAYIYREIDGVTAMDARYNAAIKNIGEGTGDSLDAAKVFKYGDAEKVAKAMRSLAPNLAIVKQGKAIARLGDEAFVLAETTNVPQNYSALIADLTDDAEKQAAMMRLLIESEPDNVFMAENIMKQALADDFSVETTIDLFGENTSLVPLYKDKAKILDRVLKQLSKEKAALANLVRNDEIVEAFGNQVNLDATQQGLDAAKALQTIVQKNAFSKGAVSELLTQAAREVQNGTGHTAAARGFVTLLRERIERDGFAKFVTDSSGKFDLQGKSFGEIAGIEQQNLFREALEASAPLGEPKAIEARYQDFKEAAGMGEMPASAKASGDTSPASQRIDQGALETSQALPSQRTKRSPSSSVFSTAKISPSKEKGGSAKIGEVDASTKKRILHKSNDVKTLLTQAENTIAPLKSWLGELTNDIKGVEVVGARVKDAKELADKAEFLSRPANQISDYLGARVTFETMEGMRDFIAKFEAEAKVIDKEDFLQAGRPKSGYRAIHLQATTKDGFSYELQVMPKSIYDVYEEGRQGYAKWKSLREKLSPEQKLAKDADLAKDKKIYDAAWTKFLESDESGAIESRFATIDLDEELPLDGFSVRAEDGREISEFKTVRDLLNDIEESDAMVKAATECLL